MSLAEVIKTAIDSLARAQLTVDKLTARLGTETSEAVRLGKELQDELLLVEEGGAGNVDAKRKKLEAAMRVAADTEQTLAAATARLAALKAGDERAMNEQAKAARAVLRTRIVRLAEEREELARNVRVTLTKLSNDRASYIKRCVEIAQHGRDLGVVFEPRAAGLEQSVFDGFVDHELGALGLPHGASWTDPVLSRPSLTDYATSAAGYIRAQLGHE